MRHPHFIIVFIARWQKFLSFASAFSAHRRRNTQIPVDTRGWGELIFFSLRLHNIDIVLVFIAKNLKMWRGKEGRKEATVVKFLEAENEASSKLNVTRKFSVTPNISFSIFPCTIHRPAQMVTTHIEASINTVIHNSILEALIESKACFFILGLASLLTTQCLWHMFSTADSMVWIAMLHLMLLLYATNRNNNSTCELLISAYQPPPQTIAQILSHSFIHLLLFAIITVLWSAMESTKR